MQTPVLFYPKGVIKKLATKKTPKLVEQKRTNLKICALLKGRVDGNQKNTKNSRRSRNG